MKNTYFSLLPRDLLRHMHSIARLHTLHAAEEHRCVQTEYAQARNERPATYQFYGEDRVRMFSESVESWNKKIALLRRNADRTECELISRVHDLTVIEKLFSIKQ